MFVSGTGMGTISSASLFRSGHHGADFHIGVISAPFNARVGGISRDTPEVEGHGLATGPVMPNAAAISGGIQGETRRDSLSARTFPVDGMKHGARVMLWCSARSTIRFASFLSAGTFPVPLRTYERATMLSILSDTTWFRSIGAHFLSARNAARSSRTLMCAGRRWCDGFIRTAPIPSRDASV